MTYSKKGCCVLFFFPQRNLYSRTHSHIGKEVYCPVPGAGKIKLAKTFEKGDK